MPAFMAGLGMRQGMPRRQFNEQPAGANQYTSALNNASGTGTSGAEAASAADRQQKVQPNTPTGPGQNYNPYAAAASGGANPWTYNAETGGYQPNSNAWMPDWMKPKPAAAAPAAKTYERQISDYTPYADDMRGTKQQAIDIMAAEAKKRGITPNWQELEGKYGSRLEGGQVTGKLFNEIMKDAFGKDVEVPGAAAPAAPAAPAATPPTAATLPAQPSNPWMTAGGGYGGYMPTQVQGQAANTWQTTPGVSTPWGTGGSGIYTGDRPVPMPNKSDDTGGPTAAQMASPEYKAKEAAMRGDYTQNQARMQELIKQLGSGGMQFMQGMGG